MSVSQKVTAVLDLEDVQKLYDLRFKMMKYCSLQSVPSISDTVSWAINSLWTQIEQDETQREDTGTDKKGETPT